VALALKSERPVVLLAASAEAAAFFRQVAGGGPLRVVETPEETLRAAEELLRLQPTS
jgi:hypothetical protein